MYKRQVYSAHNLIAENGILLAESKRFENETVYTEIDVQKLTEERRRNTSFWAGGKENEYEEVEFSLKIEETTLTRFIDPAPFVPDLSLIHISQPITAVHLQSRKHQKKKTSQELLQ